eukprot:11254461-Heterocapsa_arctica.AAC.1
MIRFMGPKAIESHARMRTLSTTHGIRTTETAKHLGVLYHFTGTNGPELRARILRAQANWYTLGRFWRAAAIPLRIRLIMFHALVVSTLIMALETCCLTAWELQKLETFQVKSSE